MADTIQLPSIWRPFAKWVQELVREELKNRGIGTRFVSGGSVHGAIPVSSLPAHSSTHQNAGGDEISVAGLSGELADPQPPKLTVKEADGAPSVANVSEIRLTNGKLTDVGGGVVSIDLTGDAGSPDAADVTYTPAVLTDWDGDADPGDVDEALDQLAERVDDLEGGGGAGAPTTAKYVTTAADAGLSAEVVIPGLAASADIAGAGGAGTAEEFDSGASPFAWSSAPDAEDVNTTIKSHLYLTVSDGTERLGTKAWSPAGALDARTKITIGQSEVSSSVAFGLLIADADASERVLLNLSNDPANQRIVVAANTYTSATYTQRGSSWYINANVVYLQITRDGSNNWRFWWSTNGLLWQLIATQSFTFTVAKIGFRLRGPTSAGVGYAGCDWLRTDV